MLLKNMGLGELPKNSLLLIEEDLGGIKSTFLQILVLDYLKTGKKVMYISTRRSAEDITEEFELIRSLEGIEIKNMNIQGDLQSRESFMEICNHLLSQNNIESVDFCFVDTLSSLFMEESIRNLKDDLNLLLNVSRRCNITFFFASDMGILQEREERFLRSMVDGIIQFRTEYQGGKANRYINIPKMRGISPIDKLIPFRLKEGNIVPDTRERIG